MLLGLIALPMLGHAPNRLLSGQPIYLSGFPRSASALLLVMAAAIACAGLTPERRPVLLAVLAMALAIPVATGWGAGTAAADLAATSTPLARTSVGAASWLVLLASYLVIAEAVRRLALPLSWQATIAVLAVAPLAALVAGGRLAELSILKEYAVKRDIFGEAVVRHGQIVLASFVPAMAIGLPLGVVAHRSPRMRGPLLGALGLIQTIPSIALFGLLMAPLSRLAETVPWVRDVGISGVGLAPAAIALTLYSLLPMVRNMAAGLAEVSPAAIDAAAGMGMSRWQILAQIELPLALPVILSGMRITLVQAIGLAAVASLIGAGGLGAIMFQGLFANAGDLILLGAVPIVVLAVGVDILFRLLASSLKRSTP